MTEFSTWIQDHARGDLDAEMTQALVDVAEGVLLVDKKPGTVTLTVTITKSGRMLVMSGDIKTKIPKPEAESSMHYLGDDGLTRDDPYQLQSFDRANQPLYEVGSDGVLKDVSAPADDDAS